ncbi:hypothetical protein [Psychrobacter sp.]|uniref:hypothetical protein n=1 Tax=Psychrobacter sp. TaxID=56811 RepID=UPI0026477B4D|nr:hypothetical protein [Psychrobacter sp.]MDN6276828.1 hypothetical protein [Psychrobacter sp.]MDN6307144.1 hypothetical protein [Psychrobacter sp.]
MNTIMNAVPCKSARNSAKYKRYYQIVPAILFSALLLTACQKDSETDTANNINTEVETITETATSETNTTDSINDNDISDNADSNSNESTAHDINLSELDDNLGAADRPADLNSSNNAAAAPDPEQAIQGAQITDVRYENASGDSLSVIFETSAAGVLNAIVTLPNKTTMTLRAPEGQGNNPTYRSEDGSIQLVSHAGGGTIDLVQNDNVTSFDAISADAEVVTE